MTLVVSDALFTFTAMKKIILSIALLATTIVCFSQNQGNTITISGRVTDFEDNPIDSCEINLRYSDFSIAYTAFSDNEGYYFWLSCRDSISFY